jgi:hypothetical protein
MLNFSSIEVTIPEEKPSSLSSKYKAKDTAYSQGMSYSLLSEESTSDLLDQAIEGNIDWVQELNNMADVKFNGSSSTNFEVTDMSSIDPRNEAIKREKKRIALQKISKEYTREDFFSIGTVYLSIPPTQISVSEEKHNLRFSPLRGKADAIVTTGKATTRIDLEIIFNGLDDINTKLRPLLAQLRCIPFLPIDSPYLRYVLDPEASSLEEKVENLEKTTEQLSQWKENIDSIKELQSASGRNAVEIINQIQNLKHSGVSSSQINRISTVAAGWYIDGSVSAIYNASDAKNSIDGGVFNLTSYIYKVIGKPADPENTISSLSQTIYNLDKLSRSVESIKSKIASTFDKFQEERFKQSIMVGVLSQLSLSTMVGFPETLSCRITFFLMNYLPFTYDFGFIQGEDPSKYTADICQCDAFINWYAGRFLRDTSLSDSLNSYTGSDSLVFTYVDSVSYEDLLTGTNPTVTKHSVSIDTDAFVTGISVSFKNFIQFIPLLSGFNPTCQYMGSYNSGVSININTKSIDKVKEIRKMSAVMSKIARTENRLGRYNFFQVENSLLSFCGLKYFALDSHSVDTVPGNPGLYSISMNLTEIDLNTEQTEHIDRITLDDNERLIDVARYIYQKTCEYLQDTSEGKQEKALYKQYYDFLFGNNLNKGASTPISGWIREVITIIPGVISGATYASSNVFPEYFKSPEWDAASKNILKFIVGDPAFSQKRSISDIFYEGATGTDISEEESSYGVDRYVSTVRMCMSGRDISDPYIMDVGTEGEVWARVIAASSAGTALKTQFLNPDSIGNTDLKNYAFTTVARAAGLPRHIVDPTCYPDMDLPLYNDLGGIKDKFKLTYRDVGLLSNVPNMRDKPVQIDWVAVEPDFFFWKQSVYSLTENGGRNGLETALSAFKDMAATNQIASKTPIDPRVLIKKYLRSMDANETRNFGLGDSVLEDTLEKADDEINAKACKVIKINNANEFVVQAYDPNTKTSSGTSYTIKAKGYDPESGRIGNEIQGGGGTQKVISKNEGIARNILQSNEDTYIFPVIDPENSSLNSKGVAVLGATISVYDPESKKSMSFSKAAKAKGAKEYSNNIDKEKNDEVDRLNNSADTKLSLVEEMVLSLAEQSYVDYKLDRTAVLVSSDDTSESKKKSSTSQVLKNNKSEVLSASAKSKDSGGIKNQQYIYKASQVTYDEKTMATNNTSWNKYDRWSSEHINNIADRIVNQKKDNTIRMVRAFPTFKFYFVEEDRMEYTPWPQTMFGEFKRLDDLFSYSSIISVSVTKSRKEAADVAVVQILNTTGVLSREKYGSYDTKNEDRARGVAESSNMEDQETYAEQEPIEEFILQPGSWIKIKMGYTSDPTLLETVFTGKIAEVGAGDVITIVAQGYGVELLNKITGHDSSITVQTYSAYKLLNRIIRRPEIMHFGFKQLVKIVGENQNIMYRRYKPYTGPFREDAYNLYKNPSCWRSWRGVGWFLRNTADPRNSNIWTPDARVTGEEFCGKKMNFWLEGRTVWDIFQEFTRRMPGYLAQVIPFDNRATLYFGPPDHFYIYSDEVNGLLQEVNSTISNTASLVNNGVSNGKITSIDSVNKKKYLDRVNTLVNNFIQTYGENITDTILTSMITVLSNGVNKGNSAAYLITCTMEGTQDLADYAILNDVNHMCESGGINLLKLIGSSKSGTFKNFIIFNTSDSNALDNLSMYEKDDGSVTDRDTYIASMYYANSSFPANAKLARSYHYKDSLRDIVANNIVATDENMWNRVEVYNSRSFDQNGNLVKSMISNPLYNTVAMADDSIWKETVKTKICVEPNAKSVADAHMYAMGNLKLGINEMYQGSLVLLGDPDIKPNDVIFIDDYYTNMHGPIEVRDVTHHFSHETGFITTVTPDCCAYANNSIAFSADLVAGGWYDDIARCAMKAYKVKIPYLNRFGVGGLLALGGVIGGSFGLSALSNFIGGASIVSGAGAASGGLEATVAGVGRNPFIKSAAKKGTDLLYKIGKSGANQAIKKASIRAAGLAVDNPVVAAVAVSIALGEIVYGPFVRETAANCILGALGWSLESRTPINFLPLSYCNRPYVAGLRGFRRDCWWEPIANGFERWKYNWTYKAPGEIHRNISAILRGGSTGNQIYKVE